MYLFRHVAWLIIIGIISPLAGFAQSNWSTESGGTITFDDIVMDLGFDDDGRLYVGGYFKQAGGKEANGLARWDGQQWEGLGDVSRAISNIHIKGDEIFVAGHVLEPHSHLFQVAKWTEDGIIPIGQFYEGCCDNGSIQALVTDERGRLYVGGNFHSVDSLITTSIVSWDRADWDSLGTGVTGPGIFDIVKDVVYDILVQDSSIYIAGSFDEVGGEKVNRVARWNGFEWHSFGYGLGDTHDHSVYALALSPGGNLIAGGSFGVTGDKGVDNIVQWNGESWESVGSGINGVVTSLTFTDNYLYAAHLIVEPGQSRRTDVVQWDGVQWQSLDNGVNGYVNTLKVGPDGSLYAVGRFTEAGKVPAINLARWTGDAWEKVGIRPDDSEVSIETEISGPTDQGSIPGVYPNPFSKRAQISVQIPHTAQIRLTVYDMQGNRVAIVTDRQYPSGLHRIILDASTLANGAYLYRLNADDQVLTGVFYVVN